jgi:hypothetical protein
MPIKKSFEARANECLSACEEYCKSEVDPFGPLNNLKTKIEDPIKAYHNNQVRWLICRVFNRLKDMAYSVFGTDLWEDPKNKNFCDWLNCLWGNSELWKWAEGKEFSSVSPKELEEIGFRDGDEMWTWCTPDYTWEHMFGTAGVCVVRKGMIIWSRITAIN